MVTNDMPILAVRTGDEHSPVVVALLGDLMRRAFLAGFTCKGELVARSLDGFRRFFW